MIAIAHEVHIADLPQIDRRQIDQSIHRAFDAAPARFECFSARQKAPVEVAVAALTTDDMIDQHYLLTERDLAMDIQAGTHGPEGQHVGWLATNAVEKRLQQCFATRFLEAAILEEAVYHWRFPSKERYSAYA